MSTLETFLSSGVFAFMLVFVRVGTGIMLLPGFGDFFVPQNVRLLIALALSLVLAPVVAPSLPSPVPGGPQLAVLIVAEFVTGLFIGTVARIFMTALDTAGMMVSMTSGLGSAQMFNPAFATQGSLVGAFLSISGVMILLAADMHHFLLRALVGSYTFFPVGGLPDTGSMAEQIARTVSASFLTGIQIAIPFIVLSVMIYVGMGVLSRLMPQIQVFLIAVPVQIVITLLAFSLVVSSMFLFWAQSYESSLAGFLRGLGG